MADDVKRISRETLERVDGLSDEARAELARDFAGGPKRKASPSDSRGRRPSPIAIPFPGRGGASAQEEAEREEEIARVSADLRRTNRRLDRIERAATGGRYKTGSASAPSGRYARLLTRADRLERELRALNRQRS